MYELPSRLGKWKPAITKRAQTTQLASFWALGMPFFFFLHFFNILTNDLEIPIMNMTTANNNVKGSRCICVLSSDMFFRQDKAGEFVSSLL